MRQIDQMTPAELDTLITHTDELAKALRISTTTLETVFQNDKHNIAAKCCIERNRAKLQSLEDWRK